VSKVKITWAGSASNRSWKTEIHIEHYTKWLYYWCKSHSFSLLKMIILTYKTRFCWANLVPFWCHLGILNAWHSFYYSMSCKIIIAGERLQSWFPIHVQWQDVIFKQDKANKNIRSYLLIYWSTKLEKNINNIFNSTGLKTSKFKKNYFQKLLPSTKQNFKRIYLKISRI
jgi:hypothetical protein